MAFFDEAQEKLRQSWGEATRAVSDTAMEQLRFVREFARLCTEGSALGWHECNGGNLSYRLTPENVESARRFFEKDPGEWVPLGVTVPLLGGAYFLVTGAGKYLSRVADDPKSTCGIVEIDPTGAAYRVVWGLSDGARPTSELPSHLLMCAARMQATRDEHVAGQGGNAWGLGVDAADAASMQAAAAPTANADGSCRVLYHAHPVSILAATALLPQESQAFTQALWGTFPEGATMFPEGVGVVPWMTPGGSEIAQATAELMQHYAAVVWANHGLFVAAATFDEAFGTACAIDKAANVYLQARAANGGSDAFPNQVSKKALLALAQAADVADTLPRWMH